MSVRPAAEPICDKADETRAIETLIEGRERDIGGFTVRRILPSVRRRSVGPYVFWDHMGPAVLEPGQAMDVRPHPHINLATVTYLFAGQVEHRDSTGARQVIRPGAINLMTAGRGIVHSERSPQATRETRREAHGIQLWLGLPTEHEECEPAFAHHPAESLPEHVGDDLRVRVLIGEAFGLSSPVQTLSRMYYLDARLDPGAAVAAPGGYDEGAAYVVEGTLTCGDRRIEAGTMAVFADGTQPTLSAEEPTRVMLLGGDALDGPRHLYWNFVSSRKERLQQAKDDWRNRRFPDVPGDSEEWIPLPE